MSVDVVALSSEIRSNLRMFLETCDRYDSWDIDTVRSQWLPLVRTRLGILPSDWDMCWPDDMKRIILRVAAVENGATLRSLEDTMVSLGWDVEADDEFMAFEEEVLNPLRSGFAPMTISASRSSNALPAAQPSQPQSGGSTLTSSFKSCPTYGDLLYDGEFHQNGTRGQQ